MKKIINFMMFVAGLALVMASGNVGTVKAYATEDTENIVKMADVVKELKLGYNHVITYEDDVASITFRWDIIHPAKMDMIFEDQETLEWFESQCDRRDLTVEAVKGYYTDWHVQTTSTYYIYDCLVMT